MPCGVVGLQRGRERRPEVGRRGEQVDTSDVEEPSLPSSSVAQSCLTLYDPMNPHLLHLLHCRQVLYH